MKSSKTQHCFYSNLMIYFQILLWIFPMFLNGETEQSRKTRIIQTKACHMLHILHLKRYFFYQINHVKNKHCYTDLKLFDIMLNMFVHWLSKVYEFEYLAKSSHFVRQWCRNHNVNNGSLGSLSFFCCCLQIKIVD